ncbi:hypothetical protein [Cellulomonas xiejunii]|uniref:Uncharacterized protein n=1 Tax=Cellulomonas xiejunii TaxID=2968083 RepID=A0ABY5KPY1_9CELL|nr:hypothetical protein [Cellulomonas xiejunii]MCC2322261.1 hypothetical protein [Cellulomonas xiejunii]UUI72314.1 hypothetical protein NP048_02265 [Cellulomonas xiejunii]
MIHFSVDTSGAPQQGDHGLWTAGAWPAHLSDIVRATDPGLEFVVVEDHCAADWRWTPLAVPLSEHSDAPASRWTVRRMSFDLLLTPVQLRDAAPELQTATDGGALIWQSSRRPPDTFALRDKHGSARAAAMRGLDIRLVIDVPHDGEVAVLTAPTEALLVRALERLGTPG